MYAQIHICVHVCVHMCAYLEARGERQLSFLRYYPPCSLFQIITYFKNVMCIGVLPVMYVCTTCLLGEKGGQRRVMDPPELELQMVECCGIEYLFNYVKMC